MHTILNCIVRAGASSLFERVHADRVLRPWLAGAGSGPSPSVSATSFPRLMPLHRLRDLPLLMLARNDGADDHELLWCWPQPPVMRHTCR